MSDRVAKEVLVAIAPAFMLYHVVFPDPVEGFRLLPAREVCKYHDLPMRKKVVADALSILPDGASDEEQALAIETALDNAGFGDAAEGSESDLETLLRTFYQSGKKRVHEETFGTAKTSPTTGRSWPISFEVYSHLRGCAKNEPAKRGLDALWMVRECKSAAEAEKISGYKGGYISTLKSKFLNGSFPKLK
jgi:hypothetical protein